MRRLLILGVSVAAMLVGAGSAWALSAGTSVSCTFSSEYGTPSWSAATGGPMGTKTVCSKTTLAFDHDDTICRDGELYLVPVFFGTAEVDFFLGKATTGESDAEGRYHELKENATPASVNVVFAGFVDDDDNAEALGTPC